MKNPLHIHAQAVNRHMLSGQTDVIKDWEKLTPDIQRRMVEWARGIGLHDWADAYLLVTPDIFEKPVYINTWFHKPPPVEVFLTLISVTSKQVDNLLRSLHLAHHCAQDGKHPYREEWATALKEMWFHHSTQHLLQKKAAEEDHAGMVDTIDGLIHYADYPLPWGLMHDLMMFRVNHTPHDTMRDTILSLLDTIEVMCEDKKTLTEEQYHTVKWLFGHMTEAEKKMWLTQEGTLADHYQAFASREELAQHTHTGGTRRNIPKVM